MTTAPPPTMLPFVEFFRQTPWIKRSYTLSKLLNITFNCAFFLGMLIFLYFILKGIIFVSDNYVRPYIMPWNKNYINYGSKERPTWAVVTGGSDGIGYAMCEQLGEEGFNICIIARNENKMIKKCKELEKTSKNKNLKTKYIVCDLGKLNNAKAYQDLIKEHLSDIDVGILVLNAGVTHLGPFDKMSTGHLENIINLNCGHVAYFLHSIVPSMKARNERSAIMVTSSFAAERPMSGFNIYCATKAFASYLAIAVNYELQFKIDVTVFHPGLVKTRMMRRMKGPDWYVRPPRAAAGALRDLGYHALTHGRVRFDFYACVNWLYLQWGLNAIVYTYCCYFNNIIQRKRKKNPDALKKEREAEGKPDPIDDRVC